MYTANDLTLLSMSIIHDGLVSGDKYERLDTAVKFLQVIQLMEYPKIPAVNPQKVEVIGKGKKKSKA